MYCLHLGFHMDLYSNFPPFLVKTQLCWIKAHPNELTSAKTLFPSTFTLTGSGGGVRIPTHLFRLLLLFSRSVVSDSL